jgi:2-polyprenyl-6-methoxyphenol hydroxylase-like FAD-dependent oxidoreductase
MEQSDFKVIIAGAGIVGLTMASALEKAGIDYTLFERYPDVISPQKGAGIAIHPHNARLLHQLGCFKEDQPKLYPCRGGHLWNASGAQLNHRDMGECETR